MSIPGLMVAPQVLTRYSSEPTPEAPPRRRTRSRARDSIIVVGAAQRAAMAAMAAAEPALSAKEHRVLTAVIGLTSSYSRLVDRYSLEQVADAAGLAPGGNADTRRKEASRALRRLRDRGIVVYEAGDGRRHCSLIGLPHPSEKGGAAAPPVSEVERGGGDDEKGGAEPAGKGGRERPPTRVVLREDLPLQPTLCKQAVAPEPEGKGAERQEPTDTPSPVPPAAGAATLRAVLEALPPSARADVLGPGNTGARINLERGLGQLRAQGWAQDRLVAEFTTSFGSVRQPAGALVARLRERQGTSPPPEPEALGAADAVRQRSAELHAATAHGRAVAAAVGNDGNDEGRALLEGYYGSDPEALRASLDGFGAVLGDHGVAPPPLRAVPPDPDPRAESTWRGGLAQARAQLRGAGGGQ